MFKINENRNLILDYLFLLRKRDNISEEFRSYFDEMLSIIDRAGSSDREREIALNTAAVILDSVK